MNPLTGDISGLPSSCGRTWPSRLGSGRSVKLLLAFASTIISGLNLLEIHDQDLYSLLDMFMFINEASSSTRGTVGVSM
jgi:hypothetical protein